MRHVIADNGNVRQFICDNLPELDEYLDGDRGVIIVASCAGSVCESRKLLLRNGKTIVVVNPNDILFAESGKRKTSVHLCDCEYEVSVSLSVLEHRLSHLFCRAHNSYLVNVARIESLVPSGDRSYEIRFFGSDKVAWASRGRAPSLISRVEQLCIGSD